MSLLFSPLDQVLAWNFKQPAVEIASITLAGSGGGIFGSTVASEARTVPAVGTEVRIVPYNRERRRANRGDLRGVITDNVGPTYTVRHHATGRMVAWPPEEVEAMSDLELLAEVKHA